jgi:hypothetical protein
MFDGKIILHYIKILLRINLFKTLMINKIDMFRYD